MSKDGVFQFSFLGPDNLLIADSMQPVQKIWFGNYCENSITYSPPNARQYNDVLVVGLVDKNGNIAVIDPRANLEEELAKLL